jgi:uncharacterized protein (TIGR02246 family)
LASTGSFHAGAARFRLAGGLRRRRAAAILSIPLHSMQTTEAHMRTTRAVPLLLLLLVPAACQPAAENETAEPAAAAATDPAAANAAVGQLRDAWVAAAERDDAAAIAALYTDDAIFITSDGAVQQGRAAIQSSLSASLPATSELKVTEASAATSGDVRYETGTYTQKFQTPGGTVTDLSGTYLVVAQKQGDGSWKIVRHGSWVNQPAPATTTTTR